MHRITIKDEIAKIICNQAPRTRLDRTRNYDDLSEVSKAEYLKVAGVILDRINALDRWLLEVENQEAYERAGNVGAF